MKSAQTQDAFGLLLTHHFVGESCVSQPEMQEIVEGTGWRVAEFIGDAGGQYVGVIEKEG